MSILLDDLLEKLPSDAPDRVKAAKERFNARIREALRRETRLGLQRRQNDTSGAREDVMIVPIVICPGLPEALMEPIRRRVDEKHRLSVLLSPHRQMLVSLRDSGKGLSKEMIPALEGDELGFAVLGDGKETLESAWRYADFLCRKLEEFDLTKSILNVNADVLGVYRYSIHKGYDDPEPKIELYWGVIGLVARDLGVNVEDLTCVVLGHELAHAYTHVGSDADNQYWNTCHFSQSTVELKEGLAQFYTELVCKRLEQFAPGAKDAYKKLLPKQPAPYHVQEERKDSTPELVRHAMLGIRRTSNDGSPQAFWDLLEQAQALLGARGKSQGV